MTTLLGSSSRGLCRSRTRTEAQPRARHLTALVSNAHASRAHMLKAAVTHTHGHTSVPRSHALRSGDCTHACAPVPRVPQAAVTHARQSRARVPVPHAHVSPAAVHPHTRTTLISHAHALNSHAHASSRASALNAHMPPAAVTHPHSHLTCTRLQQPRFARSISPPANMPPAAVTHPRALTSHAHASSSGDSRAQSHLSCTCL